jgi:hypothetical protein
MVKFLVEKGIDSISVNADVAKEISDYAAEIEKQMGEGARQYQPSEVAKSKKEVEEIPSINGIEKTEEKEGYYKEEIEPYNPDSIEEEISEE